MSPVFAEVPISSAFQPAQSFDTIGSFVSVIVKNAFMLAGVIAFVLLVLGGFGIIVGAGGDPKQMEKGKQTVTGAVIGLLVVIGSFWIVQLIQYLTGTQLLPMK